MKETNINPPICDSACEVSPGLDFRPEFVANHFQELVRSGWRREEAKGVASGIFERDLKYLFWERFTKEKIVHFEYRLEGDKLLSPKYEELGDISARLEAGIEQRVREGRSADRERAENEGILKVKDRIVASNRPLHFLLYSPPPPFNERCDHPGYADGYSFKFLGSFHPESDSVDMFAVRHDQSISAQREEANTLLGGDFFSQEVHPNDFLRAPIFLDEISFESIRGFVANIPNEAELNEAKSKDFSKFSRGIGAHAKRFASLIEQDAGIETLRAAQVDLEMDFTRWVSGEAIRVRQLGDEVFVKGNHLMFRESVMVEFAAFSAVYETDKFSCGSCGGSALSLFSSAMLEASLPEFFARTIPCPGCGESVREGSAQCNGCGLTKADFDSGKSLKKED